MIDIVSDEEFVILEDEEEGEIPETPKKEFVDLESSLSDIRCCFPCSSVSFRKDFFPVILFPFFS